MGYKTIRQILAISSSTEIPESAAQREYETRLNGPASYRSGLMLDGKHEIFAVAFRELIAVMDQIRELERDVERLWRELPGVAEHAYLLELIGAEMQSSNEIESVRSTRREIDDALESAASVAAVGASKRFREFARLFLNLSANDKIADISSTLQLPTTLEDIRAIYDRVMADELDASSQIEGPLFRQESVSVWDESRGCSVHDGVPANDIPVLLTQWLNLLHNEAIPPLLRAVMCHYAFETIHPFYDGNGRTGRFLLALQLSKTLSVPAAISISPVIADAKRRYYKIFEDAQFPLNCSDISLFCCQMLEFVAMAQRNVISDLGEKRADLTAAEHRLQAYIKDQSISQSQQDILYLLIQKKLFDTMPRPATRKFLCSHLGCGERKVTVALEALNRRGLLAIIGQRPIRYSLSDKATRMLLG